MQKECTYTLDGLISREGGGTYIYVSHVCMFRKKKGFLYSRGTWLGGGGIWCWFYFYLKCWSEKFLIAPPLHLRLLQWQQFEDWIQSLDLNNSARQCLQRILKCNSKDVNCQHQGPKVYPHDKRKQELFAGQISWDNGCNCRESLYIPVCVVGNGGVTFQLHIYSSQQ